MSRVRSIPGPAGGTRDAGGRAARALPGLLAVAAVVGAAFAAAAAVPALSPLIAAMVLGAGVASLVRRVPATAPGTALAGRTLLRAGIVLLGLHVSLGDLAGLGAGGLAIAAGTLVATFAATLALAARLGVRRDLALLIGAGSAICGASAIAALQPVTRAREEDVGYAVATVTLFGTLAMVAVPVAGPALGLDPAATGLWAGASIHEVAQVAGAGAAISASALKLATLVKLARVALLAPVAALAAGTTGDDRAADRIAPIARHGARVPGFLVAFLGCVLLRSVAPLPAALLDVASLAATVLLAAGLAALGLQVRPAALRAAGPRPLLLGLAASLTASAVALALVLALG